MVPVFMYKLLHMQQNLIQSENFHGLANYSLCQYVLECGYYIKQQNEFPTRIVFLNPVTYMVRNFAMLPTNILGIFYEEEYFYQNFAFKDQQKQIL